MSLLGFFDTPLPLNAPTVRCKNCVFVILEIGDMQAYVKPFVLNCGIKLHQAL